MSFLNLGGKENEFGELPGAPVARIHLPMQGTNRFLIQGLPHALGQLSPCTTATELLL